MHEEPQFGGPPGGRPLPCHVPCVPVVPQVPSHEPRTTNHKKIFKARDEIVRSICDFSKKIGAPPKDNADSADKIASLVLDKLVARAAENGNETPEKPQTKKRKYKRIGNGLKGPKTTMMQQQKRIFASYLRNHPIDKSHSRTVRASACWLCYPEWEESRFATGDAKGYSCPKSLARAK